MVIASAGRNIALSCLQVNKACSHCMTTYFLLIFIISTSGSFTCHDLPVSVETRFRSRESLFFDRNHTGSASRIAIAELFTRNDNYIISICHQTLY